MDKETRYKAIIKENLENVLSSGFVPSLGEHSRGKVSDVHKTKDSKIIKVTTDRVSAFDKNLSADIPFKRIVLNTLSSLAMEECLEVMPNAMVDSPDPSVIVQDYYENLGFECIVRGYVWGSMAKAYESGERNFCGIELPDDLLRYQKLDEPLFTPTTKAEKGQHDENVTLDEIIKALTAKFGDLETATKLAEQAKEKSLELYKKQAEYAEERGLLMLDTKYEFGLRKTESGEYELVLIDEAGTPDSSRFCDTAEHEKKWSDIKFKILGLSCAPPLLPKGVTVSKLIEDNPELKITEMSKQYLRDVLVERAKKEGVKQVTDITEEDVIETAYRYIDLCERMTGNVFDFEAAGVNIRQNLMSNLIKAGYTKGGTVVVMAGSDSDWKDMEEISKACEKYGIATKPRIASAHKQGSAVEEMCRYFNESIEPVVIVSVAGGVDALSGTASWHSNWPVVNCQPKSNRINETTLNNPPGSSNVVCLRPANVARFAAQSFGYINPEYHDQIQANNNAKVAKLEAANKICVEGTFIEHMQEKEDQATATME